MNIKLRDDLAIIAKWIPPKSTVLDLGCGDGMLLQWLCEKNQSSTSRVRRSFPKNEELTK